MKQLFTIRPTGISQSGLESGLGKNTDVPLQSYDMVEVHVVACLQQTKPRL